MGILIVLDRLVKRDECHSAPPGGSTEKRRKSVNASVNDSSGYACAWYEISVQPFARWTRTGGGAEDLLVLKALGSDQSPSQE